jgi:hypothetical protein
MPAIILPLLGASSSLGLLALSYMRPPAQQNPVTPVGPDVNPIIPTPVTPTPSGPRPLPKGNLPVGTQIAVVHPACGLPTDPPDCAAGLYTHTTPSADTATRIGPHGDPRHAYTGEEIGVLQDNVDPVDGSGGKWAQVITAGNPNPSWVRQIDPQGRVNFTYTGEVIGGGGEQPIVTSGISGVGGYGYGYGHAPTIGAAPGHPFHRFAQQRYRTAASKVPARGAAPAAAHALPAHLMSSQQSSAYYGPTGPQSFRSAPGAAAAARSLFSGQGGRSMDYIGQHVGRGGGGGGGHGGGGGMHGGGGMMHGGGGFHGMHGFRARGFGFGGFPFWPWWGGWGWPSCDPYTPPGWPGSCYPYGGYGYGGYGYGGYPGYYGGYGYGAGYPGYGYGGYGGYYPSYPYPTGLYGYGAPVFFGGQGQQQHHYAQAA